MAKYSSQRDPDQLEAAGMDPEETAFQQDRKAQRLASRYDFIEAADNGDFVRVRDKQSGQEALLPTDSPSMQRFAQIAQTAKPQQQVETPAAPMAGAAQAATTPAVPLDFGGDAGGGLDPNALSQAGEATAPNAQSEAPPLTTSIIPEGIVIQSHRYSGGPLSRANQAIEQNQQTNDALTAQQVQNANAAQKEELKAAEQKVAVEKKTAELLAPLQERGVELASQYEKDLAAHQQEVEARTQQQMGELNLLLNNIAETKIDPGAYWASRSTGQQIGGYIGMLLGSAKEAFVGGENPAMSMIDRAIQRDLAAQTANLENRRNVAYQKQGVMGRMMEQFGNKQQAIQAAYMASLKTVDKRMEAVAGQLANPAAQANLQAARAQIAQKYATAQNNLIAGLKDDNGKSTDARMKMGIAEAEMQTNLIAKKMAADAAARAGANGEVGFLGFSPAQSKEVFSKDNEKMGAMIGLTRGVQELLPLIKGVQITKDGKAQWVKPDLKDRYFQVASGLASMKNYMKTLQGMGANFTANEEAMIDDIIGGKWFGTVAPEVIADKLDYMLKRHQGIFMASLAATKQLPDPQFYGKNASASSVINQIASTYPMEAPNG